MVFISTSVAAVSTTKLEHTAYRNIFSGHVYQLYSSRRSTCSFQLYSASYLLNSNPVKAMAETISGAVVSSGSSTSGCKQALISLSDKRDLTLLSNGLQELGSLPRISENLKSPTNGETRMFYEIVVAPKYTQKGLEVLRGKSKTLRILEASQNSKGKLSLRIIACWAWEVGSQTVWKAGNEVKGSGLASDAFFPFGPGGSIRDNDAIDCCNKYGVSLLFTNVRHFRH